MKSHRRTLFPLNTRSLIHSIRRTFLRSGLLVSLPAVFLSLSLLVCRAGLADVSPELLSPSQWYSLPTIEPSVLEALRKREPLVLQGLEPFQVRVLTREVALDIFKRVSDQGLGWGPLRLFTDEMFCRSGHGIFIPKDVLLAIDESYETHLLHVARGITVRKGRNGSKVVPSGTTFEVEGMAGGNGGWIWSFYPHELALQTKEYPFLTGRYDLSANNRMKIEHDSTGRAMLTHLEGRNGPDEPFRPMLGPMNVVIERFVLSLDGRSAEARLRHFGTVTVDHRTITRKLMVAGTPLSAR